MEKKKINKLKREHNELSTRIDNLIAFTKTDEFTLLSGCEKEMLLSQLHVMNVYLFILGDRISYYEGKPLILVWRVNNE